MKKILLFLLLIPTLIFAQNNSNTLFINKINDLSFFDKNSEGNYEFTFIYKNSDNIKELSENLKKSINVKSCSYSENKINIKFKTNDINVISKTFIDNGLTFLDFNTKTIPIEYIKIDNSEMSPPDNNVEMRNDNILYHEYIINSIKFKLHYVQSNLTKLSNAAKTGHLSSTYTQITKEKEIISELNN